MNIYHDLIEKGERMPYRSKAYKKLMVFLGWFITIGWIITGK